MLNQMSRPDPRDPFPAQPEEKDYTVELDRGVKGLKIGLVMKFGDQVFLDPEVEAGGNAAAKTLEGLGAIVEPIASPTTSADAGRVFVVHWFSALQRLLQLHPADKHAQFDPQLLQNAKVGEAYSVQTLVDAMAARREMSTAWNLLLADYDLVISPTLNVLAFPVGQPYPDGPGGAPNYGWSNTALFNLTRHPAITTPTPLGPSGLPIGLQIVAAHYPRRPGVAGVRRARGRAGAAPFRCCRDDRWAQDGAGFRRAGTLAGDPAAWLRLQRRRPDRAWRRIGAGALPETAFVSPNAPERCPGAPGGYQWWALTGGDRAKGAASAAPVLDGFIDAELARHGLDESRLALVGFSQGTMMALQVGPRRSRPLAGIVGYSGMLADEAPLADPATTRPPILLIHGDADPMIPIAAFHRTRDALVRDGFTVESHVSAGLGHSIDMAGLQLGGRFLAAKLAMENQGPCA